MSNSDDVGDIPAVEASSSVYLLIPVEAVSHSVSHVEQDLGLSDDAALMGIVTSSSSRHASASGSNLLSGHGAESVVTAAPSQNEQQVPAVAGQPEPERCTSIVLVAHHSVSGAGLAGGMDERNPGAVRDFSATFAASNGSPAPPVRRRWSSMTRREQQMYDAGSISSEEDDE